MGPMTLAELVLGPKGHGQKRGFPQYAVLATNALGFERVSCTCDQLIVEIDSSCEMENYVCTRNLRNKRLTMNQLKHGSENIVAKTERPPRQDFQSHPREHSMR